MPVGSSTSAPSILGTATPAWCAAASKAFRFGSSRSGRRAPRWAATQQPSPTLWRKGLSGGHKRDTMHALANPARFLRLARPLTAWLLLVGLALAFAGMAAGLTLTPPDYLQGETVRILYIHVPSAWLGMTGWAGIAAASVSQLVWRHPLAAVAGRAVAPAGATFSAICLITGSIWGRPTWGTWWEWDGRLTSMLVLFFLYLGYI